MIKNCKICGKQFEAKQKNYTLCSPECRKENSRRRYHSLDAETKKMLAQQYKEWYRRKIKGFPCKFCGEEVKPFIDNRLHRHHWHEECLINKCIEAIKNGETFSKKSKILRFASNKGFTKADILEIAKERGETV